MNYLSPFAARAIVADMPPPPYYHRRDSAEAWVYLLIICAICAAAIVGLCRLFRRRSHDSTPKAAGTD
jgi:predicted membrane protein